MRILSIGGDGHDVAFTVLENGLPLYHIEKERHTRIKMDKGHAAAFALKNCKVLDTCSVLAKNARYDEAGWLKKCGPLRKLTDLIGPAHNVWHHTAHAAHGFYSSNFENALIFTIDGGGAQEVTKEDKQTMLPEYVDSYYEQGRLPRLAARTATTVWAGRGTKINALRFYSEDMNLGQTWAIVTRTLGLSTGTPQGNQAGTVMAMAAMGDPTRFSFEDKPASFIVEALAAARKQSGEQADFDAAASVQAYTDKMLKVFIEGWLSAYPSKHICLSGGCVLNSVFTGKMLDWFDGKIYVCPVPYDGGLSFGEAQYVYHHVLGKPRIQWDDNCTPYLGYEYHRLEVLSAFRKHGVQYE